MKRPLIVLVCLLPALVDAHVGSPNVFFEGMAGAYPVRVIIRPPAVLPGPAQVDVRVDGVTNVTLQAALWEAGAASAPPPVPAAAVAGEPNLLHGVVWLYFAGLYGVRLHLEGDRGAGTVMVPLNSTALIRPSLPRWIAGLLTGLGALLFAGAVGWIGLAARDGTLEPGASPKRSDRLRSKRAAMLSALVLAGGVWAGNHRWENMHREFNANALYQPVSVRAAVRSTGNLQLLELTPAVDTPPASSWDDLAADHGKLMHLFLLREPGFDVFAHLHPVRRDAGRFEAVLPALAAGRYLLYGEITRESGMSSTLVATVTLPEPLSRPPQALLATNMLNEVFCLSAPTVPAGGAGPFALDADDSWHVGAAADAGALESRLMGGARMILQNMEDMVADRELRLRFAVFDRDGEPAAPCSRICIPSAPFPWRPSNFCCGEKGRGSRAR